MMKDNNTAQPADQEIEAIMAQAQVFASAWAFFLAGSSPEQAERERSNLRALLSKLRAEGVQAGDERAACPTDVCQAGKSDGVLCANDECDRANGVRPASAPVAGETESQCANCGKPASQAEHCISEYPEDGEWFCSEVCFDQHGVLDCPQVTHSGYRHPAEAARLIAAENVLRSLASWLGCGGFNPDEVNADEFEQRIREGVDSFIRRQSFLASAPVAGQAQAVAWMLETTPDGYALHRSFDFDEPPTSFPGLVRKTALYAAPQASERQQPIVTDARGVERFKENRIVSKLLEVASAQGWDMNRIAMSEFSDEDRRQFAQLIGYSVSGYGGLPYAAGE